MDKRYALALARSAGRPVSNARQLLRALREAGLVPGHGETPTSVHTARVVMALSADLVKNVVPTVTALRTLPITTPCGLPATAEAMLTRLIEILPHGPVFGDYDVDDGFVHIATDSVSLECLTLTGHRACARYGAPFAGIAHTVTIPVSSIRAIAAAIKDQK